MDTKQDTGRDALDRARDKLEVALLSTPSNLFKPSDRKLFGIIITSAHPDSHITMDADHNKLKELAGDMWDKINRFTDAGHFPDYEEARKYLDEAAPLVGR